MALSNKTLKLIKFDLIKLKVRLFNSYKSVPVPDKKKLHIGCGSRLVKDWLNVDLTNSEFNLDLASGKLPWSDKTFEVIVSQHLIEHLEFDDEFLPLLKEFKRVSISGGGIWLTTPDMHEISRLYIEGKSEDLFKDRKKRFPSYSIGRKPYQYMLNEYFHQNGEHKNLIDFNLLKWALEEVGFYDINKASEGEFLDEFPEFPKRNDDNTTLYVRAKV